jgi:hypothetical protein
VARPNGCRSFVQADKRENKLVEGGIQNYHWMCGQKELCNGGVVVFLCFWLAGLTEAASRGDLARVAAVFMTIGQSEGRDGLGKMG